MHVYRAQYPIFGSGVTALIASVLFFMCVYQKLIDIQVAALDDDK